MSVSSQNPYPGLRPFREDESHLFFGREGQSAAIHTLLRRERFVAIVGVSGCGKSSLIKAGLFPLLHGGCSGWRIASMRPGSNPLGNLASAMVEAKLTVNHEDEEDEDEVFKPSAVAESSLRRSTFGIADLMEQLSLAQESAWIDFNVLLLVDQFEELFRYGNEISPEDREHFVRLLIEAVQQQKYPVHVVITMRSDFLGDCARFRDLPELINRAEYLVPRMSRQERREAIEGPSKLEGVEVAPRLVNRLLDDMGDDPDQLPVLQHALRRAWDRRVAWMKRRPTNDPDSPLDLSHYKAVGTLSRALSRHADVAYRGLSRIGKPAIAEAIFRTITLKGEDNRGVRRPTKLGVISAIARTEDLSEVVAVIDVFRDPERSFLVPPVGKALDGEDLIDISHESLMRNWERLKRWVDQEGKDADDYWRLVDSAERWKAGSAETLSDLEIGRMRPMVEKQAAVAEWCALYATSGQAAVAAEFWQASLRESAKREADKKAEEERERSRAEEELRRKEEDKRVALELQLRDQKLAEAERRREEEAKRIELEMRNRELAEAERRRKEEAKQLQLEMRNREMAESERRREEEAKRVELERQRNLAAADSERRRKLLLYSFGASVVMVGLLIWALIAQTNSRKQRDQAKAAKETAETAARQEKEANAKLETAQSNIRETLASSFSRTIGQTDDSSDLTEPEIEALWDLAELDGENEKIRGLYLTKSFSGYSAASRFAHRQEIAVLATAGLSPRLRNECHLLALEWLRKGKTAGQRELAADTASGFRDFAPATAAALAAAMREEKDFRCLASLGRALVGLGEKLPAESAASAATALATAMEEEKDSDLLVSLGRALAGLGEKLPAESADSAATTLATAMKEEKDPGRLTILGEAMADLGERLPVESAASAATTLAAKIGEEQNDYRLVRLSEVLTRLGEKLPAESMASGARRLAAVMQEEKAPERLTSLGLALAGLGERLPAESAASAATTLVTAMRNEMNSFLLANLGEALAALGEKLPAESAASAATALATAMEEEKDFDRLASLGKALAGLGENLPAESAASAATALVTAMQNEKDSDRLASLGETLAGLGEKLPAESAAFAATTLVTKIQEERDSDRLDSLGETLAGLGKKLPAESVAFAATTLVTAMQNEKNSFLLPSLGEALAGLGEKLPAESAASAARRLAAVMQEEKDPFRLASLGKALAALGEKLPAESAAFAATTLVTAMQNEKNSFFLANLGKALAALGEKLPAESAASAARRLATAMQEEKDPRRLAGLGSALVAFGKNLPEKYTGDALGALFLSSPSSKKLKPLEDVLKVVASKQDLVQHLKNPFCIGEAQKMVLAELEARFAAEGRSDVKFEGDISNLVLRGKELGLDLETPPQRPPYLRK